MEFILISEQFLLDYLNRERAQSPEDFLVYIENALESGELTIDEVAQLMHDFIYSSNRRHK